MVIKKILLSLGALGGAAGIGYGLWTFSSSTSYKGVVLIKSTWKKDGRQFQILKTIVDEYNRQNPDKMRVELMHIPGGPGTIAPLDAKDIQLHHMDNVSNIIIDYPDNIGILSSLNAQLDLSKYHIINKNNNWNIRTNGFFKNGFLDLNDYIEHTTGKKDQLYFLPLGTSTDMLSINKPVLGYILNELKNKGQVQIQGKIVNKILDEFSKLSSSDEKYIESLWKFDDKKKNILNNFIINDDIFSNYKKLLDFAYIVKEVFSKNNREKNNKNMYVLGIDAPTNVMYQAIFAKANFSYKPENFVYGIEAKQGKVIPRYDGLQNPNSAAATNFKNALRLFEKSINNGSVRFNGSGKYTSNDMVKHQAIFSWGSTAGYTHNYVQDDVSKYGNFLLGKYNIIPKSRADLKKIKSGQSLKDETLEDISSDVKSKIESLLKDPRIDDWLKSQKIRFSSDKGIEKEKNTTKAFRNGKYFFYLLDDPTIVKSAGNESLQKGEVKFIVSPSKVTSNGKDTFMLQGPSFIPVKHDNDEDKGVADFLKWFFDENTTINYLDYSWKTKKNEQKNDSLITVFQKKASYIIPKEGAFKDYPSYKEDGNKILSKAFQTVDNKDILAFQAPVTRYSGKVRKVFDSILHGIWDNDVHSNGKTHTAEDIYSRIADELKIDLDY